MGCMNEDEKFKAMIEDYWNAHFTYLSKTIHTKARRKAVFKSKAKKATYIAQQRDSDNRHKKLISRIREYYNHGINVYFLNELIVGMIRYDTGYDTYQKKVSEYDKVISTLEKRNTLEGVRHCIEVLKRYRDHALIGIDMYSTKGGGKKPLSTNTRRTQSMIVHFLVNAMNQSSSVKTILPNRTACYIEAAELFKNLGLKKEWKTIGAEYAKWQKKGGTRNFPPISPLNPNFIPKKRD